MSPREAVAATLKAAARAFDALADHALTAAKAIEPATRAWPFNTDFVSIPPPNTPHLKCVQHPPSRGCEGKLPDCRAEVTRPPWADPA